MKKLLTLSIFLLITLGFSTYSQIPNPTWLRKITHEAGLDSARGGRIWLADINNDNYPDLFWGEGGVNKNNLYCYLNVPNPDQNSDVKRVFIPWTDSSRVRQNRNPEKMNRVVDIMSAADINNDGNIDLVTSIYYHRLQMYQNGGDPGDRSEVMIGDGKGHFYLNTAPNAGLNDVSMNDTLPSGLINATGMAYIDYDYDGILDLYISTWFTDYANNTSMPDLFLKGNGDGSFTRRKDVGLQTMTEPEYGINVTDFDNDGWQDIITSPYCRTGGHLFKNQKTGRFIDNTDFANYGAQKMTGDHGQALCQWSAQPADYDNDGDIDLLQVQVHGGYNENEGRTHLAINSGYNGGYRFNWDLTKIQRDAPLESHLGDQGGNFFDIDNDGWLDVAIGQSSYPSANLEGQERLYICRQDTDNILKDISKAIGVFNIKEGHTPIPGDYDLDGDVDLFISHTIRDTLKINDSTVIIKVWTQIELLRNDIGSQKNWFAVKLNPTPGSSINKSAIGSRIHLITKSMTQIREIQTGQGHFAGQMPFIQTFGIEKRNYIDSVYVRWSHKDLITTSVKYPPLNTISELDNTGKLKVIKTWEGTKGIIAFDAPFINFDTVRVGIEKLSSFKIKNLGDGDLVISSLNILGSNSIHYSLSAIQFPVKISPNESYTVPVTFNPSNRGDFACLLQVASDAFNQSTSFVELNSYGYKDAAIIAADSGQLNFGKVFVDSSKKMKMSISNKGELPLVIDEIKFENNADLAFSISMPALPRTLQPKEKLVLDVSFSPQKEEDFLSRLVIKSNSYKDSLMEIALWGSGDVPRAQIKVSPTTLFMGTWATNEFNEKDISIENAGNGDLTVNDISVMDETMKEVYTLPGTTLPFTINPLDQHTVKVRFAPKEDKIYNTKLSIKSNAVDEPDKQVTLRGTGIPAGVAEINSKDMHLTISVSPNPLTGTGFISINSETTVSNLKIKLFDVYGRNLMNIFSSVVFNGTYETSFECTGLTSGTYYISAFAGSQILTLPVLIIK